MVVLTHIACTRLGDDRVDCTVGSALDMCGGDLPYADVLAWHHSMQAR